MSGNEPWFQSFFSLLVTCLGRWAASNSTVRDLLTTFSGQAVEIVVRGDCAYRLEFTNGRVQGTILRTPVLDSWYVVLDRDAAELVIYDGYIDPTRINEIETNMKLAALGRFRGLLSAVREEFDKL